MSNYNEQKVKLVLTKANVSKLVSIMYKAKQVQLNLEYAFYRALYDNLKKTKVESKRLQMIDTFIRNGRVPIEGGQGVPVLKVISDGWVGSGETLASLLVDGKLTAPKKSDYKSLRPSGLDKHEMHIEHGEQSVYMCVSSGCVTYAIENNNRSVERAAGTWFYRAVYGFINSHKFGRTETGTQRYSDEYNPDPSYTYYGNAKKREQEELVALSRYFARKHKPKRTAKAKPAVIVNDNRTFVIGR